MPRTPDEFPGQRIDESILLLPTSASLPASDGEIYYSVGSPSGSGFFFREGNQNLKLADKVRVSSTDTTPGHLKDKIYGAAVLSSGSNEQLMILASGSAIPATQVGQVLFSADGTTFGAFLPITTVEVGWIIQDDGIHIVVG